jgi:thioesterase domain-containing protein
MTPQTLQDKLHTQVPMTKLMQLHIQEVSEQRLISTAPLDININDKGTAFGGSLNTMAIISSWALCYTITQKLNVQEPTIVISKNQSKFKRPVTKDLHCMAYMPSQDELTRFKDTLEKKSRASLTIYAQIIENEKVCMDFEGTYVINAH